MNKAVVEGHRKDKLKHIDLTIITVGERFREDYGDLDELIASIREKGIIQPLSVDSNMNLLAGGRRHAAATKLGLPTVPVIIREFIDEIDSREIELMENVYRKDFGWAEQAKLTERIDALYKEKHGSNWSGRKTAELLDRGVATVARNIQLAGALKIMPELANLGTADEALKMLKKLEGNAVVDELRRRQIQKMEGDSDHADGKTVTNHLERGLRAMLKIADQNYMIGDVFKGMAGLKTGGNIQIIECDPPYGIDLNEQKASKESVTSNVHTYEEVPKERYQAFLDQLTSELFRVAGKDCWLVFWYGPTWHQAVLDSLRRAGWHVDDIPAIWTKAQGQTMQPEIYLARGYEPFFMCRKGKPVMVERGRLNVFNYPGVAGAKKYHPTQRPIELIMDIFNTIGAGRQNVFVPFLGSGASLLACYEVGFTGFGFDLNGEYKDKFMLEVEKQTRKNFTDAEKAG
jgi:ParB/RepB/Spo0J family partition protein